MKLSKKDLTPAWAQVRDDVKIQLWDQLWDQVSYQISTQVKDHYNETI